MKAVNRNHNVWSPSFHPSQFSIRSRTYKAYNLF